MTTEAEPALVTEKPPAAGLRTGLLRDPFRYLMDAAARHEGLVRIGPRPLHIYVVSHPDYIRRILVTNAANYPKGSMMAPFRAALGNGLVTSEGDYWKRQRRLMQPAFHNEQLQAMESHITGCVERAVERWHHAAEQGVPVDILDEAIQLNVEIVLGALFSTSIDSPRAERLRALTSQVFVGLASKVWTFFLPRRLPLPGAAAYRRAVTALDTEVYRIITERRATENRPPDLLGLLLDAEDTETGERMSDRQLRDEIFTLFMAGYETTATATTWISYELARNPEIAEAVVGELGRLGVDGPPDFATLPRLEYQRRVIDEAFRLHPPFPIWFRGTLDTDVLGPYRLPKNAKIIVNPHITHRDPRFWADPEKFDPDRFSPERFDSTVRHAYYPFGKGSRICIGERLAVTITQMVVTELVRNFEFTLSEGFEVIPQYVVTCQPKGGLPLVLRER
ncbi:cytochrome P450 [Nocardia jinanensis]|uniref:Cytochrome P450 n=1 Tax=Nocardia jinanensis TaxID=382504 RepID=A0A917RB95_9NOCA|nr:cytochrome P450 [Nocardia jinanensis]GGK98462.1 cytochrome P450 [Nocardia jinanensis]